MIELIIGPNDGVITNASIPIRWCLDSKTLDSLEQIKNPYVLITLQYDDGYTEDRFLTKLSKYMDYYPCRRSGKVKISAYIVSATSNKYHSKHNLKRQFLSRNFDGQTVKSHIESHSMFEDKVKVESITVHTQVDEKYIVHVPKYVFGKELPNWLKFAVNRYMENQLIDECHRNRRLISFILFRSIFFLIETVWLELRLLFIILFSVILGFFRIDLTILLHPFDNAQITLSRLFSNIEKTGNIIDIIYDNIKHATGSNKIAQFIAITCSPILLPLFLLYSTVLNAFYAFYAFNSVYYIILPFVFSLLLAMIVVIIYKVWDLITMFSKYLEYNVTSSIKMLYNIINFNYMSPIHKWNKSNSVKLKKELLTCDIKEIPLKDRSISLIYSEIKNKICKPMRR